MIALLTNEVGRVVGIIMPAIFIDENGETQLFHSQERIDAADLIVDEVPEEPLVEEDEMAVLYVVNGEVVYQIEPRPMSNSELEHRSIRAAAQVTMAQSVRDGLVDDKTIKNIAHAFPRWRPNLDVEVGEIYQWDNTLVEVIQDHTTQADWKPGDTPALWKVHRQAGTVTEWVQPQGAHDAYQIGDRVTHNGQTWECTDADAGGNNSWEPGVFGWTVVTG